MKLLFDQNVSPKLVARLASVLPGSRHVFVEKLDCSDDTVVWDFAIANDFAIVSKDVDYRDLSTVRGHPPKVLWLRTGNCSTASVESLLRTHLAAILAFENDPSKGTLELR